MEWKDEALVLSIRAHGETAAVVELLTRENGRHFGLVHGARSRRHRPTLQIGNHVDVVWKARLPENLGQLQVELRHGFAAQVFNDPAGLAALASLTSLARLLPERDPHPSLFEISMFVLGFLDDAGLWPALYVRWEVALLEELGFGLDLSSCAATGVSDNLVYVSPKTGRAVSSAAGAPFAAKLLALPRFLRPGRSSGADTEDIMNGLKLTEFFFQRHIWTPQDLMPPKARDRLIQLLTREMKPFGDA
ncbi:MAG: DNA repair protein RecO [Hyphomicrobiaceae bacterium]